MAAICFIPRMSLLSMVYEQKPVNKLEKMGIKIWYFIFVEFITVLEGLRTCLPSITRNYLELHVYFFFCFETRIAKIKTEYGLVVLKVLIIESKANDFKQLKISLVAKMGFRVLFCNILN